MTMLPTGEAAATERRAKLLRYADEIERLLIRLPGEIDREVRALLGKAIDGIRANPEDPMIWNAVSSPARFAQDRAYADGRQELAEAWEHINAAARQGSWMAFRMRDIAQANAPICETHGAMVGSDDWRCLADAGCKAPYWWLDGTRFVRKA